LQKAVSKLHHLLSTQCQPGIYNPRLDDAFKPKVFNIPVEEHLKQARKNELSKQPKQLKQ